MASMCSTVTVSEPARYRIVSGGTLPSVFGGRFF